MDKQKLLDVIETSKNDEVVTLAKAELQKLELIEQAAKGDDLSKALLVLKDVVDTYKRTASSGSLSKTEMDKLLKQVSKKAQISFDDLDPELKARLSGSVKVQMTLKTPDSITTGGAILMQQVNRPLFQKLLSDFKARNNVYLYGGAGTGKTYVAEQFANFIGYEYIEVNCNQFTSPLDLIGGQTIEGYQKGKLEIAWTNEDAFGNSFSGAILCLDELPKLDPNTAGVLNAALAKLKNVTATKSPFIYNGQGQKIYLKNLFIIATGNTQLNETSTEYEANFKQDLSLQDRFVGSTYEVVADYESEFDAIMKGYAFIFIYLIKVREIILANQGWSSRAFVSVRIMMSVRDTYIVYRSKDAKNIGNVKIADGPKDKPQDVDYAIGNPKTIKQAIDSFINLFNTTQQEQIRNESGYDEFMNTIVPQKDKMPLDSLDTDSELKEVARMIKRNNEEQAKANR